MLIHNVIEVKDKKGVILIDVYPFSKRELAINYIASKTGDTPKVIENYFENNKTFKGERFVFTIESKELINEEI